MMQHGKLARPVISGGTGVRLALELGWSRVAPRLPNRHLAVLVAGRARLDALEFV